MIDHQISPGIILLPSTAEDRGDVRERIERTGVPVSVAVDLADMQRLLAEAPAVMCLIDLADRATAISAIRVARAQAPHTTIAAIADSANPAAASEALQVGANDVLPWPFDDHDVALLVADARDAHGWDPADRGRLLATRSLFAHSPAMRRVMEHVRHATATREGVLVCGEPGTGRELTARAIHGASSHATDETFVVVRCDVDPPQSLEQRLFGVVTDRRETPARQAVEHITRASSLWLAQGGTLLLANVADAPARVQIRLARILRDREAWLVEDRTHVDLDVRPIAACDTGIEATVAEGRLRRDLFDRLSATRIDVPPLRRRREDIPLLAAHFLTQACARAGAGPRTFSRSALALLAALPWHGNAKELLTLVETLVRTTRRLVIQLDDVLEHAKLEGTARPIEAGMSLKEARARFERDCISAVLLRHHGRMGEAAKALGIQRTNLYRKVRQLKVARALVGGRR